MASFINIHCQMQLLSGKIIRFLAYLMMNSHI